LIFFIKEPTDSAMSLAFGRKVSKKVASLLREERVGWGIGLIELSDAPVEESLTNLLIASEQGLSDFDAGQEVCIFDEKMQEAMRRRTAIERELAELLKHPASSSSSSFFLQFQPIWDVKTQEISGFEALARMTSPVLGSVSPTEFIEVAEKAKLIVPLGKIIITKALQFLSLVEKDGFSDVGVSINISAIQLMNKDFFPSLMEAVEQTKVNTMNITLEVTESVFISKFQEVNDLFSHLQQQGMSIAIDDFGSGYANYEYLFDLPIDILKIDGSLIKKVSTYKGYLLVESIVNLAKKLDLQLVAEYVENEAIFDKLKPLGIDMFQGYCFAKPKPLEKLLKF